ncbi:MAG: hypothetical protein JKY17_05770 [Magnetovibrio sp.]|nr:hypothetical protein [Magnetovibrio sp.]
MTNTHNTPTTGAVNNRPKMWVFFVIFSLFAGAMYGGTMYRIRSAGFMGIGKDQLAHPVNKQPQANQSPSTQPAPSTTK